MNFFRSKKERKAFPGTVALEAFNFGLFFFFCLFQSDSKHLEKTQMPINGQLIVKIPDDN